MKTTSHQSSRITLAELTDALARLLANGYRGSGSGRVRDLPDARTVRWYQTTGLMDRPLEYRGRTALFGRRHLLQLAAVKKLQASGVALADVQKALTGTTEAELAKAAGVTLKAADAIIAALVHETNAHEKVRLSAALAGKSPDAGQVSSSRRKTAFWANESSLEAAAPELHSEAFPAEVPTALQSRQLGKQSMVVWQGRCLTAAEQERFEELATPLAAFLESLQRAESSSPSRPSKKTSVRSPKGVS